MFTLLGERGFFGPGKLSESPTCRINLFTTLGRFGRRLDELLQALVIDVGSCPFWDLVAR